MLDRRELRGCGQVAYTDGCSNSRWDDARHGSLSSLLDSRTAVNSARAEVRREPSPRKQAQDSMRSLDLFVVTAPLIVKIRLIGLSRQCATGTAGLSTFDLTARFLGSNRRLRGASSAVQ
jgi:hypothetical protein